MYDINFAYVAVSRPEVTKVICPQTGEKWCCMCYANLKGRSAWKGHLHYHRPRRRRRYGFMLRRRRDDGGDEVLILDETAAGEFGKKYPELWRFLSAFHFEDLTSRQTGTLLLFIEQGRVKGCLNDRECGEVTFVTAGSVDELLERLEVGLREGKLDWRFTRPKGKGSSRN